MQEQPSPVPDHAAALDFALLRASLLAAQAATPTAVAGARAGRPAPRTEAPGLLGQAGDEGARRGWRSGRFFLAGGGEPPETFMTEAFTVRFQPSLKPPS